MTEIPERTGKNRNEKGQFLPGASGNPEGRPEGTLSIVAKIKEKLGTIPDGQKKTYLEMLVLKIMKKAILDEDVPMIKDLINRIDGMPRQSLELSGGLKTTEEKITKLDDTELDAILQRVRAEIAQGKKPEEGAG